MTDEKLKQKREDRDIKKKEKQHNDDLKAMKKAIKLLQRDSKLKTKIISRLKIKISSLESGLQSVKSKV